MFGSQRRLGLVEANVDSLVEANVVSLVEANVNVNHSKSINYRPCAIVIIINNHLLTLPRFPVEPDQFQALLTIKDLIVLNLYFANFFFFYHRYVRYSLWLVNVTQLGLFREALHDAVG